MRTSQANKFDAMRVFDKNAMRPVKAYAFADNHQDGRQVAIVVRKSTASGFAYISQGDKPSIKARANATRTGVKCGDILKGKDGTICIGFGSFDKFLKTPKGHKPPEWMQDIYAEIMGNV